jgi:uncharacterized protein (DUF2336 family)
MIVRRFLSWVRTAPIDQRAEAVSALARAYLHSDLCPHDRSEAALALLAMLDDPAPVVRRTLAETLSRSPEAPRPIVVALAQDTHDIAALVLEHSPVLTDADLVDQAALAAAPLQEAIARRARISAGLAGALAEVGAPEAIAVLLGNPGAIIADVSLARIVERCGDEPRIREALLARPDLPVEIRLSLVMALSKALRSFAAASGWLSIERLDRATRESREKALIGLVQGSDSATTRRIVEQLRQTGHLTASLILRAILSQGIPFAEAAFAELTKLPVARVSSLLRQGGSGCRALYRRAGMPATLEPALLAALSALYEPRDIDDRPWQLARRMIERALTACERHTGNEAVVALLHRHEAEVARGDARMLAQKCYAEEFVLTDLRPKDLDLAELPALAA